jgi:hypothetical protein
MLKVSISEAPVRMEAWVAEFAAGAWFFFSLWL